MIETKYMLLGTQAVKDEDGELSLSKSLQHRQRASVSRWLTTVVAFMAGSLITIAAVSLYYRGSSKATDWLSTYLTRTPAANDLNF